MLNIAIIGSSGSIGSALTRRLASLFPEAEIHAFSRRHIDEYPDRVYKHVIARYDEETIRKAAAVASASKPLDLVIVATGILHDENIMPEKSLRDMSVEKFQKIFEINTILPAMVAKYFLPLLNKEKKSVFAALSARVGSISDNELGGWYAYRASKSALNMIIKSASIEMKRTNPQAIVIGLHPGTVDSPLSRPFQGNVSSGKLFTPTYAAERLISVIESITGEESGKCFAWDGEEIKP